MRPKLPVLLLIMALAAPALAQELRIVPVPPHVRPQWTPLPGNATVSYAPNVPTDVFRHRGRYYFIWEGYWYHSRSVKGPWKAATQVPPALTAIDPAFFKQAQKAPPATPKPPPSPPGIRSAPAAPGPPAFPSAPPPEAPPPPPPPLAPGEHVPAPKVM